MFKFTHIILLFSYIFSYSTFSSENKEDLPQSLYSFTYGHTYKEDYNQLETIYITNKSTLKTKENQTLKFITEKEKDFFELHSKIRLKNGGSCNLTLPQLKFFYRDKDKSVKAFYWSIFYKRAVLSPEDEENTPHSKKRKISEEKSIVVYKDEPEEDIFRNFSLRAYSDLESLKKDHKDFSLVFFLSKRFSDKTEKLLPFEEVSELICNDIQCKIIKIIPNQYLKKLGHRPDSIHAEEQFFDLFERLTNRVGPHQPELWPSNFPYKNKKAVSDPVMKKVFRTLFTPIVDGCILNLYNTYDICSKCRSKYHSNAGSSLTQEERLKYKEGSFEGKFSKKIKAFLNYNSSIKTPDELEIFLFNIGENFYDFNEYYLEEKRLKVLNNKVYNELHILECYNPFEGEISFSSYDAVPVFSYIDISKSMTIINFSPFGSKFSKYLKNASVEYKEPYKIIWRSEKLSNISLDEKDIATLGSLLYENRSHLSELNLSKNGIGKNNDESFRILFPSLMSLSNLTSLDLSYNTLNLSSYKPLSDALGKLIKLKKLNLNTMNCEDSFHNNFWILVSSSLKNLKWLESIQVKENDIVHEGFKQIMEGLKDTKSLRFIGFEDNFITRTLKEETKKFEDRDNFRLSRTTYHLNIESVNPVLFTCVTYSFINNLPKECKFYFREAKLSKKYKELLKQLDDIKDKLIFLDYYK